MRHSGWSLATRLAVWYAFTAFLLVTGAGLIQYRSLVTSLAEEDDQELLERLHVVVRSRAGDGSALPQDPEARMIVRFLDASCAPVTPHPSHLPPPACITAPVGRDTVRDWRSPGGRRWKIAVTRVSRPSAEWIEVLLDRSSDDRVLAAYVDELLLVLGAALGLAAALGYGLARRGLRPLTVFAHRVGQIDARSLDRRLGGSDGDGVYPHEVRGLAVSLDNMLDRLERAVSALSEFSAELAHELRTPIHVLRQQAEVALQRTRTPEEYRDVLGGNLEELDRMRRMVDDMLFLARSEDPRAGIDGGPLRLADEVSDVIDFLSADAADRHIDIRSAVPPSIELHADRMLLRRALVNVISNALHHTPAHGQVKVSARQDAGGIAIDISDTGAGIPEELLPRVFDRHVRGPESVARQPQGAGLGLAIVRAIVTLHGGTAAATSAPGQGTTITLLFPAAARLRLPESAMPAGQHETKPNVSKL